MLSAMYFKFECCSLGLVRSTWRPLCAFFPYFFVLSVELGCPISLQRNKIGIFRIKNPDFVCVRCVPFHSIRAFSFNVLFCMSCTRTFNKYDFGVYTSEWWRKMCNTAFKKTNTKSNVHQLTIQPNSQHSPFLFIHTKITVAVQHVLSHSHVHTNTRYGIIQFIEWINEI